MKVTKKGLLRFSGVMLRRAASIESFVLGLAPSFALRGYDQASAWPSGHAMPELVVCCISRTAHQPQAICRLRTDD